MKVVALKIWKKQDKLMRVLVEAGLYSSLSECLRTAAWDYLKQVYKPMEEGKNKLADIPIIEEYENQFSGSTVSITAKFPISMINMIDLIVHQKRIFRNRSDFFRAALIGFLITDSQLFSPFLLE